MNFGEILKNLRKERGLTHASLANKIGYSKAIIGFWENGKKIPTLEALIALANFFNVTLDFLAGRENEVGTKIHNNINGNGNIVINGHNNKIK